MITDMWNRLISDLIDSGLTESKIVISLESKGIKTTQPTINRIKSGVIKNPGYELGIAITKLHREVTKRKAREAIA